MSTTEPVKNAVSGNKTYILLGAGIVFNVLAKFGFMPESMSEESFTDFVNWIVAFGSLVFMRMGVKKVEKKVE